MGWRKPMKGSLGTAFIIEKIPSNRDSCSKCIHYDDGACMKNNVAISDIGYNFYKYCKSFSKNGEEKSQHREIYKNKNSKKKNIKNEKERFKKIKYIELYDYRYEEIVSYHVVDSSEVDILNNKISDKSEIIKALYGKKKGDVVEVYTLDGIDKYKILILKF